MTNISFYHVVSRCKYHAIHRLVKLLISSLDLLALATLVLQEPEEQACKNGQHDDIPYILSAFALPP